MVLDISVKAIVSAMMSSTEQYVYVLTKYTNWYVLHNKRRYLGTAHTLQHINPKEEDGSKPKQ